MKGIILKYKYILILLVVALIAIIALLPRQPSKAKLFNKEITVGNNIAEAKDWAMRNSVLFGEVSTVHNENSEYIVKINESGLFYAIDHIFTIKVDSSGKIVSIDYIFNDIMP